MEKKLYEVPVLAKLPKENKLVWFNADLFQRKKNSDREEFYFDGVGVIDHILFSHHHDNNVSTIELGKIKPINIKGALTLYYRNEDVSKIVSDFVGSSFIYFYKKNGYELYSSCLNSLVQELETLGIKLDKSLEYQACNTTFGNGGFGYSSYQDIYILPENSMVLATECNISVISDSIANFLLSKEMTYKECLEYAKLDIISNIKAVLNSNYKYKMTHLTGGMDSRLVVAIIDSLNEIDSFELCCLGNKGNVDFDNAYQISATLGAKLSNRHNYAIAETPSSIEEKYIWELESSSGMLSNQAFHKGMTKNPDLIILSGGYGEFLRAFYPINISRGLTKKDIPNILGKFFDKNNKKISILNDRILASLYDKVHLFIEEAELSGFSEMQTLELFYMLNRNRYYLGNITKTASKYTSRFDPLYSPYLFKLGYLISDEDRAIGEPLFDLMNSLSPRLVKLPFGTTCWNEELIKKRYVSSDDFEKDISPTLIRFEKLNINNWMPKISSKTREKAKSMRAAAWQVEIYPYVQKKCLEILESESEIFFEYYDKAKVMRLLTNELHHRGLIRSVLRLYNTLLWLKES